MPEGPEVTVITKGLNAILKNKTITKFVSKKEYTSFSLPRKIKSVKNKGKMIYFVLEGDVYITISLGMTGVWSKEKNKYNVIEIEYNKNHYIYLNDVRKFYRINVFNKKEFEKKYMSLGPDLLDDSDVKEDNKIIIENLRKHENWTIVKGLMSQEIISGIGNYLKSEILFRSRISPHRTISSLSDKELNKIIKNGREIMKKSYECGGLSLKDYVNVEGEEGNYCDYILVYGKEKYKNYDVVREKTKDGRATFWVKELQK